MKKDELIQALAPLNIEGLDGLKVDALKTIHKLHVAAAESEQLAANVKQLTEMNAKLNVALKDAEETAPKPKEAPTLKIDGRTYELVVPNSRYKGRDVNLKVLKADKKLAEKLVEIKSGILKIKD